MTVAPIASLDLIAAPALAAAVLGAALVLVLLLITPTQREPLR